MSITSRLTAWLGRDKALAATAAQPAPEATTALPAPVAAPRLPRSPRGTLSRFDVRLLHVCGGMRLDAIRRIYGAQAARWAVGAR